MERLTYYLDGMPFVSANDREKANAKLADYEDAEEQGRLIEFPVSIGDHIYEVIPIDEGQIRELSIKAITLFDDGTYLLYCTDGTYESYFNSRRLGTLMFATREQAEARLKELEAENE